jgi:hypothetical protein
MPWISGLMKALVVVSREVLRENFIAQGKRLM